MVIEQRAYNLLLCNKGVQDKHAGHSTKEKTNEY